MKNAFESTPFLSLSESLKEFLRGKFERRIAIIGVGNSLRGNDVLGLLVIDELESMCLEGVLLLKTETSPESFVNDICDYNPAHIIIIDAANLGKVPGESEIIQPCVIRGSMTSTHSIPLTVFVELLKNKLKVKIIIIGIQPDNVDFGTEITKECREGARRVAEIIYRAIIDEKC